MGSRRARLVRAISLVVEVSAISRWRLEDGSCDVHEATKLRNSSLLITLLGRPADNAISGMVAMEVVKVLGCQPVL